MATPTYDFRAEKTFDTGIKYFFISKGRQDVVKVVHYFYFGDLNEKKIYNLGFGDYNSEEDSIDDIINTENGDVYSVFNTVLNTVPSFFDFSPTSILMIQGSDSMESFEEKCRKDCKRKCSSVCKKKDRRIKAYCKYVSREYDNLNTNYSIYGGTNSSDGIVIEGFIKNKKYDSVFVVKKYT